MTIWWLNNESLNDDLIMNDYDDLIMNDYDDLIMNDHEKLLKRLF